MAPKAKRLALGLGIEKEETKQVLVDFYKLRDDLGYSLNVELLAWLLKKAFDDKSHKETVRILQKNSADNDGPTSSKHKKLNR